MEIADLYPQLDYELILEKILEMSEEMKLWRKTKDYFVESQPQTLKDQSIGQEETYIQQCIESEMEEEFTDQLNSGLDYELILEKVLEMKEEMKPWRKTKDYLVEPQAGLQTLKDQSTGRVAVISTETEKCHGESTQPKRGPCANYPGALV